jgi:hypothetical protein
LLRPLWFVLTVRFARVEDASFSGARTNNFQIDHRLELADNGLGWGTDKGLG